MEINKYLKNYGKSFVLCKGKTLKDLEKYGFKPTYDQTNGKLIKETMWLEGGIYGDRPIMEMTSEEIYYEKYNDFRDISIANPVKKFIMNFFQWWYKDYAYHPRSNEKLNIEIQKIDTTYFNIIVDLIEDGIIERKLEKGDK